MKKVYIVEGISFWCHMKIIGEMECNGSIKSQVQVRCVGSFFRSSFVRRMMYQCQ